MFLLCFSYIPKASISFICVKIAPKQNFKVVDQEGA